MEVSIVQAQLFLLALTRVLAMIIHVPILAGRLVPNRVKIGLGLLLAIVIIPWQPPPPDEGMLSLFPLFIAIGRELLLGTLIGFGATLTFGALEVAGEIIGIGGGFGSARILNPISGKSDTVTSQFFVIIATMLFLSLNGHHSFLLAIQQSFDLVPLNRSLPEISPERLLSLTGGLIAVGVQLAFPVLGAILLTDLTLALLAKVAPQVQIFFLGIPLKVGVGLLALALGFDVLFPILSNMFNAMGARSLSLLGG